MSFSKIPASKKSTHACNEEARRKLEYERQRRVDITNGFKELRLVLLQAGEEGAQSSSQADILATAIQFVRRRTLPPASPDYVQSPEVTAFFAQ
jgi:hypothetical protein